MSKIVQVIQKLVANPSLIFEVHRGSGGEYYFKFGALAFSIIERGLDDLEKTELARLGRYSLYVYPKWQGGLIELDSELITGFKNVQMISYHSAEFGEGVEDDLQRLYRILEEKDAGLDQKFDMLLNL